MSKKRNIIYIDGTLYRLGLPIICSISATPDSVYRQASGLSGTQAFRGVTQNGGWYWGYPVEKERGLGVMYRVNTAGAVQEGKSRETEKAGYLPNIVPYDSHTPRVNHLLLRGIPNGEVLRLGCFLMDGLMTERDNTPAEYLSGSKLEFGDTPGDSAYQLAWIKFEDRLICKGALLCGISLQELKQNDLAFRA